jgi:hypothetical protein
MLFNSRVDDHNGFGEREYTIATSTRKCARATDFKQRADQTREFWKKQEQQQRQDPKKQRKQLPGANIEKKQQEERVEEKFKTLEDDLLKAKDVVKKIKEKGRSFTPPAPRNVIVPQKSTGKIVEKTPDEIDQDYYKFLQDFYPEIADSVHWCEVDTTNDPLTYYQSLESEDNRVKYRTQFLPGKHGIFTPNGSMWYKHSYRRYERVNRHGQGWKIHITARPYSAQRIAALVLPLIHDKPGTKTPFVSYKICPSIPLLRTLLDLENITGQETQAGKFLVIYPDDNEHAKRLVNEIDNALMAAKKEGIIDDNDFYPLVGDAKVGYSGGVYVRYGSVEKDIVKKVDPFDRTLPVLENYSFTQPRDSLFEDDNRFVPWPDFINKGNTHWRDALNPFNLPISWTYYYNKSVHVPSWEERPNSWKDFGDWFKK